MLTIQTLYAKLNLKILGWTMDGELPDIPKMVMIAAPHTSNWDLYIMLGLAWRRRIHIHWMGKDTIFKPPFNRVMRFFGGIPIERSKSHGVVDQAVKVIEQADHIVLAVPAEGTRGAVEFWKSGFYQIARKADVPVVFGYLDYRHKRGGFGPAVDPKIGRRAMMDKVRAFYSDKLPKFPGDFAVPQLRNEDD